MRWTLSRRVVELLCAGLLVLLLVPEGAWAARSGGSFSGRGGFRSSAASSTRSYSTGRTPSGRTNVVVMPGFGYGWGFLPFMGGGGGSLLGSLILLGVLGFTAMALMRAVRRAHARGAALPWTGGAAADHEDDRPAAALGRAYVSQVQFGLGRSARGLRESLERFASEGDTASEAGLALLLQQTSLELMREKDSIRYGWVEAHGPMNLTNGETKLNALALAERSRFQVERVRGADGKVRRSEAAKVESDEVLEYLVVTLVLATRAPVLDGKALDSREQLDDLLARLGGVSPDALLGLEVIWTPSDSGDALTEGDLLTSYPRLRGL
jgi:uncharacterized membrane protein